MNLSNKKSVFKCSHAWRIRRALVGVAVGCAAFALHAQAVTLNQVSPTEWQASNGILSLSMNPTNFSITKMSLTLNGTTTNLMDPNYPVGHSLMLYALGGGAYPASAITSGYHIAGGYLDMWVTAGNGTVPLEIESHWVIRDGDPGIHFYQILRHTASDAATSFGAATVNFFASANAFARTDGSSLLYMKNTGPNNMATITETFPSTAFNTNLLSQNPNRQVQAETVDYTAYNGLNSLGTHLTTPGLAREFITKYNYSTYAQYHTAHGYVGSKLAFWWVVPRQETMIGGPTKQYLTGIQLEYQSAHLGGTNTAFAAGEVATRMFGPYYLRFNAFDSTHTTADSLYQDAADSVSSCLSFYDNEGILTANGYRKSGDRATVNATIANPSGWSSTAANNVYVLSDNNTYFQESSKGYQYWDYANASGAATIPAVRPGSYRLTAYCLGQWGTYHLDNVNVGTGTVTLNNLTFAPRNFSTQNPVWQLGTPDRSAHEFLHGHDGNGFDVRNYWGGSNYWKDLEANQGKVVFTVGTSHTYSDWPFVQYAKFYPNLFAGVYNSSDASYNGYDYITPQYVKDGAAAQGVTPANYGGAPWEVHFTTTAAQQAQGSYVLVSLNLAGQQNSSLQLNINGKHRYPLHWYPRLGSDPFIRSGVAGYNDYAVFQFNTADLNAPGQDNVLTLSVTGSVLYDALKLEIGASPADPAIRGWNDYDWMYYSATGTSVQASATSP